MTRYRKIVSDFRYPPVRLRSLLHSSPQYGANERGVDRHDEENPRYIRITDIDRNGQLIPGLGVAAERADPRYSIHPNDLLIARSGNTVGKSLFIDAEENAIFAGYLIRFRIDPERIQPRFVFIYAQLPIYWKWIEATRRLTGQPNVNAEEYGRLELPKPPPDVQAVVVGQYDAALASYKAKMERADALLASIDDYLLAELGIALPPKPENTIDKRMFRTKVSDLGGWRFDARVHQYDFHLHSATYGNTKLGTICAINPKTVFRGLTDTDDVSFVPMDAISDRLGIIEKPDTRVLAENVGYTSFREGDLLWAKITPCMENGKSAVAEGLHKGFGYGSTEYHVLRSPDGSLDMGYLHALLRMKRVRKAAVRFFTGSSGHQRVDADFLRTLELPVPPLEKQKALAAEARERVAKAINLEKEANAELEKAKQEIEAILLGEAV